MKYFIVDAFTDQVFRGNQAGVCLVDRPLDDETMQNIAAENNLAETAFVMPKGNEFDLRWFTPEVEIDLCGHATLASAYILSTIVDTSLDVMRFHTLSGVLTVSKRDRLFEMDFPARKPIEKAVDTLMAQALGVSVLEAHLSRDMLLLIENEDAVKMLKPDLSLLSQIPDCFAVIVTAPGTKVDFVKVFRAQCRNTGRPRYRFFPLHADTILGRTAKERKNGCKTIIKTWWNAILRELWGTCKNIGAGGSIFDW